MARRTVLYGSMHVNRANNETVQRVVVIKMKLANRGIPLVFSA